MPPLGGAGSDSCSFATAVSPTGELLGALRLEPGERFFKPRLAPGQRFLELLLAARERFFDLLAVGRFLQSRHIDSAR